MLTELTKEQELLKNVIRDEWITHALTRNGEIDKEAFAEGINWVYVELLKKPKPQIVYCDSWISCLLTIYILQKLSQQKNSTDQVFNGLNIDTDIQTIIWDNIRNTIGVNIWDSIRDSVWANVRDSIRANIGINIWNNIRGSVQDSVLASVQVGVWDNVWDSIRDNVLDDIGDNVWNNIRDSVHAGVWDNVWDSVEIDASEIFQKHSLYISYYDYGWLAFYDFFSQIGILNNHNFNQFKKLVKSGVFVTYPYENIIFAVAPPVTIIRNQQGRLHCPTGPAVRFKDGSSYYYINGRNIPEWIIENPEKITRDRFLAERNSDIKGAIYEVLGQQGMFELLGAEEIDSRTIVHQNGELEEVKLYKTKETFPEFDNAPLAWVGMVCPSTGTNYLQGVEPHHTSALDAIASLSIFSPEEYSFTDRA